MTAKEYREALEMWRDGPQTEADFRYLSHAVIAAHKNVSALEISLTIHEVFQVNDARHQDSLRSHDTEPISSSE